MSRRLLTDEQAHPIALLHALSEMYGHDWMGWPPSVLKQSLEKDHGVSIARVNVAKALAAAAVATRDEFWESWESFHFLCQALNNNIPNHEDMQEHSVGQMMTAVDMALQIRRDLKDLSHEPRFSEEVARYIAAHALNQGVWYLPYPLEFSEKYAAKRSYRCNDCGSVDEVRFDDELCDTCIGRWDGESLQDWSPVPALLERGWGKNIEIFEKNPTAAVRARLEKVVRSPNTTLQETREDICVSKLLVSMRYMQYRREQLKSQDLRTA